MEMTDSYPYNLEEKKKCYMADGWQGRGLQLYMYACYAKSLKYPTTT